MLAVLAELLAHQGGWDEILLVVAPMGVIAGLLWLAKRRVNRLADEQPGAAGGTPQP